MSDTAQATAIREINQKLTTFASSTLVSYLDWPTVIYAFAMWAGKPPEHSVDQDSIKFCRGVQEIYPRVKELEAFCDAAQIPMDVIFDHLRAKKSALDESFLVETFGMEFCKTNNFVMTVSLLASKMSAMPPPAL